MESVSQSENKSCRKHITGMNVICWSLVVSLQDMQALTCPVALEARTAVLLLSPWQPHRQQMNEAQMPRTNNI